MTLKCNLCLQASPEKFFISVSLELGISYENLLQNKHKYGNYQNNFCLGLQSDKKTLKRF